MATYTTNYNLTKPELADTISPTVFANNFDTIDAALKGVDDRVNGWRLLRTYDVAGSYTWTVPTGVTQLGILMIGGGGSGGVSGNYYAEEYHAASGGGSGALKQFALDLSKGDFAIGESIACVVGAGAAGVFNYRFQDGLSGGSTSFKNVVALGGNAGRAKDPTETSSSIAPSSVGDFSLRNSNMVSIIIGQNSSFVYGYDQFSGIRRTAPFGLTGTDVLMYVSSSVIFPMYIPCMFPEDCPGPRNIFDPSDNHIYCGAGGGASAYSGSGTVYREYTQTVVERAKGRAGTGYNKGNNLTANATAPGDGGGAGAYVNYNYTSGSGHDGLILIYGR